MGAASRELHAARRDEQMAQRHRRLLRQGRQSTPELEAAARRHAARQRRPR
jgi:hypothetical protein